MVAESVMIVIGFLMGGVFSAVFLLLFFKQKLAHSQSQIEEFLQQKQALLSEKSTLVTTLEKLEKDSQALIIKQAESDIRIANAAEQISLLQKQLEERKADLENMSQQLEQKRSEAEKNKVALEKRYSELSAFDVRFQDLEGLRNQSQVDNHLLKEELKQSQKEGHEVAKKCKAFETSCERLEKQLVDIKQEQQLEKQRYESLEVKHQALIKQHSELSTSLEERETHFKSQIQQLNDNKQALTKEFENLAHKIFEEKGKTFSQTHQSSMDALLKPFKNQIEGFQTRINEIHDQSLKGNSHISAEIKKILEVGLQMSSEANNLASALKGDAQQRGAWGEAQLERTLEMSGLIEEAHFEKQKSFKDTDGKTKQTDYLIRLPDQKRIIIDSKVSLVAYDKSVSAETVEAHELAMSEHVKAVKKHIDDLASKDYTNVIGMKSPSFVLMFMPIEPAYIEVLKYKKDLFDYGYQKGIVLVSHTTLIPILRTVSNLWMMERTNAEAREISEKAGNIYNNVCLVADHLHKMGNTLGTVGNHYNNAVKALAGKQGLHGKVSRFKELSNKAVKSMPSLDVIHKDIETEKLELIVEALPNPESSSQEMT